MDNKSFWNEVAKYGVMLGLVMSGSKILEQSLIISGNINYVAWVAIEWLLVAILFCTILYRATKKRAATMEPQIGYRFSQSVNYMILISMFAAIPVACIYYVYVNSIIGYDNYIDSLIGMLITAMELQPIDATTSETVDLVIEQMRSQPQASIFATLFNTIFQYAFGGMVAGLILSWFTARKPEIVENNDNE